MAGKCKKLGNRATKAERYEAHRAKMEIKAALGTGVNERKPFILANQSENHPNYGETPAEQAKRMLEKSS